MLFFPRCPDRQDETTESPFVTDYLIQPCRELASEISETCLDHIHFITIILPAPDFFPLRNESTKCYYESVQCDNPPKIENGHAVIMHSSTKWYAKDVVYYACDEHYKLSSPKNFIVCGYSGYWDEVPKCKVNLSIALIAGTSLAALILLFFLGLIVYLRCIRSHIKGNNHTVRNRPYDAFISYEAGEEDEQFVRNEICKRFDKEYGGQYKLLIHQRDFKPGTLILANIQDAIRDTNCALALLSQLYIR